MRFLITFFLTTSLTYFFAQDSLKITYYNLLNFPSSQQDRVDTLKKILDFIQPDIFVVNELTSFNGGALIKNNVLNSGSNNDFKSALYFDGPDTDNLLFYNQNKFELYSQQQIPTQLRDISEYVLYYKNQFGIFNDTSFIYIYSIHLKAGSSSSNEELRRQEAETFKQFLVNNNRNERLIVGGDFNFYYHTEPACQEILYGQGLDLIDPINQLGNWHNNSFYNNIHTQSTRSSTGGYAGGAYGGMDDRFDIIFISNDVADGSSGIEYIANTYIADGQDGSYFNQSINSANNLQVPQDIARALFYMSDHLPVSLMFSMNPPLSTITSKNKTTNVKFMNSNKNLVMDFQQKEDFTLKIYDLAGKVVYNDRFDNQKQIEIELLFLPKGFYIVDCLLQNDRINHKFIIE
jgi:hypothetical protein